MRFEWKGLAALKTAWLSLLILLLGVTVAAVPRQQVHIDADFDPSQFLITGRAEARLTTDGAPLHDLRFLLYPDLLCDTPSTGGIEVDSVHVSGLDVTPYVTVDSTDLHIDLPDWPRVDTATAIIWFRAHIPAQPSIFGYDDNQFLLVNWYPSPAPFLDGEWVRHDYKWFLEPASDPIDFSAIVRYPDTLQLIAGGVRKVDTTGGVATATLVLEHSVGLPLFFGTEYETHRFDESGYQLVIHARADQQYVVDSLRRVAEATVAWMSDYVLPYPFDELIIVAGGYTEGGALEEPHMVLMPKHSPALTGYYQEVLIHEIVHQWFYATVCNNTAANPWMDEAITEYFAIKINASLVGKRADLLDFLGLSAGGSLQNRMSGYDFLDYLPLTYPGERYYNTRQCFANIYAKGPQVIKTLTGLIGSDHESDFWQAYGREFEFGVPTPDDLAAVADRFLPYPPGSARKILDCTNALDFQIVSLDNKPTELSPGTVDTLASSDRALDTVVDSLLSHETFDVEVVYRCVQPLGFPVGLRVKFYDGSVRDTVVAGDVGMFTWKLTGITPAQSAEIDPEHQYVVDINYLNNSLTLDQSRGAGLRLFSGLAFLVESLFSGLWGF